MRHLTLKIHTRHPRRDMEVTVCMGLESGERSQLPCKLGGQHLNTWDSRRVSGHD
jgi:hypothetical protein